MKTKLLTVLFVVTTSGIAYSGQHTDGTGGNDAPPIFDEKPGRLTMQYVDNDNNPQSMVFEFTERNDGFGFPSFNKTLNEFTERNKRAIKRQFKKVCSKKLKNTEMIGFNEKTLTIHESELGEAPSSYPDTTHYLKIDSKNSDNIEIYKETRQKSLVDSFDSPFALNCTKKIGNIEKRVFLQTVKNYFRKTANHLLITSAEVEYILENQSDKYSDQSELFTEVMSTSSVIGKVSDLSEKYLRDNEYNSGFRNYYYRARGKDHREPLVPMYYHMLEESFTKFFGYSYKDYFTSLLEGYSAQIIEILSAARFGSDKFEEEYRERFKIEYPFYNRSFQYRDQVDRFVKGSPRWEKLREFYIKELTESRLLEDVCRWIKKGHSSGTTRDLVDTNEYIMDLQFHHFRKIHYYLNIQAPKQYCGKK